MGAIRSYASQGGMPIILKRIRALLSILFGSRAATIGLIMVLFWVSMAILAPFVARYDPNAEDPQAIHQGPSSAHWFGTDNKGRDLWSRVVWGGRIVLVQWPISNRFWIPGGVAVWGVLLSLAIGCTLGLVSGYYQGVVREVVMRILDAMLAFPTVLLYLIIIAAVGASATNVVIAIMVAGAPGVARLVRSLTLDIRTRDYVRAAESRGESPFYIMFVEILPNARGPIIIDAMLRLGYAIFMMGTLGFLGLGLPPPDPDWGSMVEQGHRYIFDSVWPVIWPTVAISNVVVGLNLLADGVNEEIMRYG